MNNKSKLSIALILSTAVVATVAMANFNTVPLSAAGSGPYSVTFNASCETDGNNFIAYTTAGNPLTLQGEAVVAIKPMANVMYEIGVDEGNVFGIINLISPMQRIESVDITYETLSAEGFQHHMDFCNSLADNATIQRTLDGVGSGMHTKSYTHTSESYRTYFKIISQKHTYISEITVHYTCA